MKKSWVDDDCLKEPPVNMSKKRAQGIVHIHKTCTPPCPRKIGAIMLLGARP